MLASLRIWYGRGLQRANGLSLFSSDPEGDVKDTSPRGLMDLECQVTPYLDHL